MADEDKQLASRVARIESDVAYINRIVTSLQLDFRELRKDMGEGFKAVNTRIDGFYAGLDGRIAALRTGLEGKIDDLRHETDARFDTVKRQD